MSYDKFCQFCKPVECSTLLFSVHTPTYSISPAQSVLLKQTCTSLTTLCCFHKDRLLRSFLDGLRKHWLMMDHRIWRILPGHICSPQDTVLPLLQARSPTITRILQQVLPAAASPPPQSFLMTWRATVICTERGTGTECYCVCCEGLGGRHGGLIQGIHAGQP